MPVACSPSQSEEVIMAVRQAREHEREPEPWIYPGTLAGNFRPTVGIPA
jgi:hypothetical protein